MKSLMPFSSVTGMIVLRRGGDRRLLDRGRWLVGQREVDADPVIEAAGETGRDGDHEIGRRFGRVRLARLLERGRVADDGDDRPRRWRRGDTGDEASDRRADPAGDDPEPVDADVQDAGRQGEDRGHERETDDHRDAAAALDRLAGGQPAGSRGAWLDLDRCGPAGGRGTRSDVRLPVVAPSRHRRDCRMAAVGRFASVSCVAARRTHGCGALYSGEVARVTKLVAGAPRPTGRGVAGSRSASWT